MDFVSLIDFTANASDEISSAMVLFGILKENLHKYARVPDSSEPFADMAYERGINELIIALEGFELSLMHIRDGLASAAKEAEKGRQ